MKIRPLMLTPTFARKVKTPGRYGDGRGGLGRYSFVTLAVARERMVEIARATAQSRDPHSVPTFAEALEAVIAIHAWTWKGGGSEHHWCATMGSDVLPRIGGKVVDEMTAADAMAILTPVPGCLPVSIVKLNCGTFPLSRRRLPRQGA